MEQVHLTGTCSISIGVLDAPHCYGFSTLTPQTIAPKIELAYTGAQGQIH